MKRKLLNGFNEKALKNLSAILFCTCVFLSNANAQTGGAIGFEDGGTIGFIGGASSETSSNSTVTARTGTKSLELVTTSTSSNKYWYTNDLYGTAASGIYVHFIYWAKSAAGGTPVVDASMRYTSGTGAPSGTGSSANASSTVALNDATWTRVSYNAGSSSRGYFPAPRRTNGVTATFYLDDIVMYVSNSNTTDLTAPNAPTTLTGSAVNTNVTLNWTSNTDAATGVQATLILRTNNTAAVTPVLNDQAQYSVAGGANGPNMIGADWTIISTSTAAAATTYADNSVADGTYKYAVVLRDAAYNYSIAAVSADVVVGTVLPVKLASFKASAQTDGISLNWTTTSEKNTNKFVVEKVAKDGSATVLTEIAAAGNSDKNINYAAKDKSVVTGQIYYYRLKTIDKDGSVSTSNIVSAKFGLAPGASLSVYPNPASNTVTINLNETSANISKLLIVDNKGAVVQSIDMPANSSQQTVDVSGLKTGIYFIQGNINGKRSSSKLVKN